MPLQENLALAQKAASYTHAAIYGASNKPADIDKSAQEHPQGKGLDKVKSLFVKPPFNPRPALDASSVQKMRDKEIKPAMAKVDSQHEKILVVADIAQLRQMGNCGEQSSVAYKYLYDTRHCDCCFTLCKIGYNHEFVVLGVGAADITGNSLGHYRVNVAPALWPADAVICDPWYGQCYGVAQGWTTHIPRTLALTEPTWHILITKLVPVQSFAWINSPALSSSRF